MLRKEGEGGSKERMNERKWGRKEEKMREGKRRKEKEENAKKLRCESENVRERLTPCVQSVSRIA
jgi:hypothetical protein